MATKRNDPNYAQITGHIPKEMSLRFRIACTARGLDLSEGLEASISKWLEEMEEHQPTAPSQALRQIPAKSLQQLVLRNWATLAENSKVELERLKGLRDGFTEPSETELLRIALALGLSEAFVSGLPLKNGGKQPNGVT